VNELDPAGILLIVWVLGVRTSVHGAHANAGVAAAPIAASDASSPRMSAVFLFSRLM